MKKKLRDVVNQLESIIIDETGDFKKYPYPYQQDLIEFVQSKDLNEILSTAKLKLRFLNSHIAKQEKDLHDNEGILMSYAISNHPELEYYKQWQDRNKFTLKTNLLHKEQLEKIINSFDMQSKKEMKTSTGDDITVADGIIYLPQNIPANHFCFAYASLYLKYANNKGIMISKIVNRIYAKGKIPEKSSIIRYFKKDLRIVLNEHKDKLSFIKCKEFIKAHFDDDGDFISE